MRHTKIGVLLAFGVVAAAVPAFAQDLAADTSATMIQAAVVTPVNPPSMTAEAAAPAEGTAPAQPPPAANEAGTGAGARAGAAPRR